MRQVSKFQQPYICVARDVVINIRNYTVNVAIFSYLSNPYMNCNAVCFQVWQLIASEICKQGVEVTWEQCDNKFKALRMTYQDCIDYGHKNFAFFKVSES